MPDVMVEIYPGKNCSCGRSNRNDFSSVNRRTGTQLTMRTFHVGGTASIKQESQIVTKTDGILKIINTNLIEDLKKSCCYGKKYSIILRR